MSLPDRITDFTYEHPDRFLSAVGGLGAAGLGAAHLDVAGALAAGVAGVLFTYGMAHVHASDPALGPHH